MKSRTGGKPTHAAGAAPAANLPNDRWKQGLEIAFWLLPVAAFFAFPNHLVLISQIMITACSRSRST
jgi:branched-chain amino acid transport system permease protein